MTKPHRNWYHRRSGKGRTRLQVKTLIKNLVKAMETRMDYFVNPVKYGELLGMIVALKWVINWCDLDENFNEIEVKKDD